MLSRLWESLTLLPAAAVVTWMVWVLLPGSVFGQFQEYTPPGRVSDRPGDDKAELEEEMENALWELGALRLNPWIGLTNASVVSNSFSTTDSNPDDQELDFTMTLGAGVRGIIPFGAKSFLTLEAIPQYVFWLEQDDRNGYNHWYGGRLYGFYNRLYLEAGARRRDQIEIRSSQADIESNTRRDLADLIAEIRLGNKVHFFGGASYQEISSLEDETDDRLPTFSALDRDETLLRGGFRYKPDANTFVGIGVEASDVEFVHSESDRSNSGTSPLIQFQYDGPEFFLTGEIVFRDLEPEGETSQFVPFDGTTGILQATFNPGWRMTYSPYYRQDLSYALGDEYSYFENNRFGLRVGAILGDRWDGSIYAEAGPDDYVPLTDEVRDRSDDFTSIGIDFGFQVSERFGLRFGYAVDQWDSSLDEFDRDNGRVTLSFSTAALVVGRR